MTIERRLEMGLYVAAALLLVTTAATRMFDARDARTRQVAEAALDKLQAAERAQMAAHKAYAAFGPAASDMRKALPGLDLADAADFAIDALPGADGVLHLRAVARPEAIAGGRVAPLLVSRDMLTRPSRESGTP